MNFQIDNEEEPASVTIKTAKGTRYDINNISGRKKAELIREGEVSIDAFIAPNSMPGSKLKLLREQHKERFGVVEEIRQGEEEIEQEKKVTFLEGDLVKYNQFVTPVLKVDKSKHKVKINKREGGKIWVPYNRVKKIEPEKEE